MGGGGCSPGEARPSAASGGEAAHGRIVVRSARRRQKLFLSPRCPKLIVSSAMRGKIRRRGVWAETRQNRCIEHYGSGDAAANDPDPHWGNAHARIPAGPVEWLGPPLQLLRYPVCAAAIHERCLSWGRSSRRASGVVVQNDYREIVLTGVDITSYGANLPGTSRVSVRW